MASYKEPSFKDRAALSADAKQRALEKLKAKPPVDPAVVAARAAAREAKEAAEAKKREEKKAAIEQARLEKIAKADLQVSELLRGDEGGSVGSRIAGAGELPMLLGADFLHSHHVLISNSQNRIYFTYNGGPVFHHVTTDRPQEAQPAPTPPQP